MTPGSRDGGIKTSHAYGRDRRGMLQEPADEGFADLLKKHGIPIDLNDALRKTASVTTQRTANKTTPSRPSRKQP
jgi:hypothetical protein